MRKKILLKIISISLLIVVCSSMFFLCSCTSKKDKEIASGIIAKIEDIGEITLDKKEYIYEIKSQYDELTDKQKELVTNYDVLAESIDKVEVLEIEDEIAKDPNRNISRDDILGLWQTKYDSSSSHYWNIWFTQSSIYYMGSKTTDPGFEIIKSEYLIATSYTFDGVDKNKRLRKGEFYNPDLKRWYTFTVEKKDGKYEMYISGSPINDRFYKMG